jgi:hypothetical protein
MIVTESDSIFQSRSVKKYPVNPVFHYAVGDCFSKNLSFDFYVMTNEWLFDFETFIFSIQLKQSEKFILYRS